MKYYFLLILFFLLSCNSKTDEKQYTNNDVVINIYTVIKADVQSSNPNKSFIKVRKGFKSYDLMIYDSFGVNNIGVKFNDRNIFIFGLDEQSSDLIKKSLLLKSEAFGYKISKNAKAIH